MAVVFITSCGGGDGSSKTDSKTDAPSSMSIKPKSVSLKGDLKDYFEVVDKEYKIKIDEDSYSKDGMITVEIKRNNTDFDFETDNINPFGTNGSEDYHIGFGIEIFDESGPVVIASATAGGMSGPYSSDDVTGLINLNKGESGYIRWSINENELKGLQSFQITSALQKEEHKSYTSSSYDDEDFTKSSSSGNVDWDAVLKSYEKYIDQYIKLMKKAKNGDTSAMTEYVSMMEKASDLADKMSNAGNDLSATQMAKFVKLQTKLANAAANM